MRSGQVRSGESGGAAVTVGKIERHIWIRLRQKCGLTCRVRSVRMRSFGFVPRFSSHCGHLDESRKWRMIPARERTRACFSRGGVAKDAAGVSSVSEQRRKGEEEEVRVVYVG